MTIFIYCLCSFFFFLHASLTDCKVWDEANKVPAWIKSDWMYLGGTLAALFLVIVGVRVCCTVNGSTFWHVTLFNVFLGSIAWDWLYGWLMYHDPLYPFPNWYGGWGFSSKRGRILFDAGRLIAAALFLLA